MARLFVAVVPPDDVLDLVAALPRPERGGVRWTTRDQWHVTLRFLGEADLDETRAALRAVTAAPVEAALGPEVVRLGKGIVCVDVEGLEPVARAVVDATATVGRPPEQRPFRGHLTLARVKSGGTRHLVGAPIEARWPVGEVHLVESRLHPHGARYSTVEVVPLG